MSIATIDSVGSATTGPIVAATVTAGHAFGGDLEAVNVHSALGLAVHALAADAVAELVASASAAGDDAEEARGALALLLPRSEGGKGEVIARLRTGTPREPTIRLGANFALDSEVIERLIPVEGLANVTLTARPDRHLRLVE
jgi:hypothetical protein